MSIRKADLPDGALLERYADQPACYTDCYVTQVRRDVSLEQLILAFYETPLFKGERLVLAVALKAPSTQEDLSALARGEGTQFAAWQVEDRATDQILLCDKSGRTRSWLMVAPASRGTDIYFGSAVTPVDGQDGLGAVVNVLMPFHKLYSRALLRAARRNLA